MLTLIAARSRNGAIGRQGSIPWRAPADLAAFRRETIGGALIVGRVTWESLGSKPLESRRMLVVSSGEAPGVPVFASASDAYRHALRSGETRIYAAGGSRVYAELAPLAHRALITEIDVTVDDADAFLPDIGTGWLDVSATTLRADGGPGCLMREMIRRAA